MEISSLYFISFVLAFVAFILAFSITNKNNRMFLLLFAVIVVVNFGYYSICNVTTVNEAILAIKITYFDGTLLGFLMLLFSMQICKIKIPKWFAPVNLCAGGVVFGLVMTIGYNNIYYKSLSIHTENGITVLDKEYGPGHDVYLVMLIIYMMSSVAVILYSCFRRTMVSYIHTMALGLIELITISTYFFEKIFHAPFELLPFVYNVMEFIILIIINRVGKYDVSHNALNTLERLNEYGYILFDKNYKYIGCDDTAVFFFPELGKLEIDRKVKDPFVKTEFLGLIEDYQLGKQNTRCFTRNGRMLRCSTKDFYYGQKAKSIGFLIEIADDTEQQNHIKVLNQYNADLEEAVEAAKEANEAKSTFLSNMSHEIRTPINAIIGMTEMIVRETNEKHVLEYAQDVKSSSQMLLSLVNDILDFSKIEAGKMELVCNTYSLKDLIRDLVVMMQSKVTDKGLEFQLEVDPDIPNALCGDDMRIKQIIVNLLSNAVKYTDEGTITLNFSYEKCYKLDEEDSIILKFFVRDTGRGIKVESQEILFNSFQRIDEGKNKGIEGTGLGLAITKQFVTMMRGNIAVDSRYGRGSTFFVTIPQPVRGSDTVGVFEEKSEKTEVGTYQERIYAPGMRILVVDDVSMNLKVFCQLLKKTEIEIDTATSGKDAILKCYEKQYHMIFMDHMMPEMDGIECYERLVKDEASLNHYTPVIMLTANAITGMKEKYLSIGFADYLTKPFQIKDLEQVIRNYAPEHLIKTQ